MNDRQQRTNSYQGVLDTPEHDRMPTNTGSPATPNAAFGMGLTPHEFTAYAWMLLRAGSGNRVYESLENLGKHTNMSGRQFKRCIDTLLAKQMIRVRDRRDGYTTEYAILNESAWLIHD